jgi:deoxycytidylate deaminase
MFSLEELNNKITQLNDDKFYMDIALSLAKYSDDPSTQVGAIIVNIATGKILS